MDIKGLGWESVDWIQLVPDYCELRDGVSDSCVMWEVTFRTGLASQSFSYSVDDIYHPLFHTHVIFV
jgi:hypothetical protein